MASPEPWTLKRLAWEYGCSAKGSSEESSLRRDLEERIMGDCDPSDYSTCDIHETVHFRGEPCPECSA